MDDFYKAFEPGFNARLLSDGRCLGRGQAACLCRSWWRWWSCSIRFATDLSALCRVAAILRD